MDEEKIGAASRAPARRWWAVLALLMLALVGRDALVQPPRAPASAAAGAFDPDRAAARLARLLGDERPHPVDTPANDAVRARLVAELRALGLDPRVRDAFDCSSFPARPSVSCARVRNVVVTLGGERPGRHLLLNAHYDSSPVGPGAADDGIGVATLLEVAFLLRDAPLARPVTLLFNEGEEWGLNGAAAFLAADPVAAKVDRLINIEARGVSGPALMFETSRPNGAAIAAYAEAARRPFANSLTADFATLIPNYTDVVTFASRGWTTLSFAIIGNETRYHSPGDRLAALDRDTLFHMGSEVLAATRHMASTPGPLPAPAARAYADLGGLGFVSLPRALSVGAVLALALALALLGAKRGALGRPLATLGAALVGALAASLAVGELASLLRAGDYWRGWPMVVHLAADLTALAVLIALSARCAAGVDPERRQLAAWLLVALVGAALSLWLPGASIFFLAGPGLALAGLIAGGRAGPWLIGAGALVQLLMFSEIAALVAMLLIDGPVAAGTPLVALAALPLVAPLGARPRGLLALVALLAAAAWASALLLPRHRADRPAAFTLDYVRDDVARTAHWAVATKQAALPRAWPDRDAWRVASLPYNRRPRWVREAPLLAIPPASARRVGNRADGEGRIVRLEVRSGGADQWALHLPTDAKLVAAGLPGEAQAVSRAAGRAVVRCAGRACANRTVELRFADRRPIEARLVATHFGLPPQAAPLLAARPIPSHPQYLPESRVRVSGVRF